MQVGSLIFMVDFVVWDFKHDPEVCIIMGGPLFAICRALMNVAASQLTMRAHDMIEVFDVYRALRLPSIYEDLCAIKVVDRIVG